MTSEIDYSAAAWQESCGHFPLRDRPREELLLLHRHWMWANVQREAMGQEFGKEAESLEPGPLMMATKGISFMFVWYGLLWSVIEATTARKIDLRGAFNADIAEASPKLRKCRHAIMHVPDANELLDERIADLVGGVSATTIRRIHRGFGRLFREEMVRRTAENKAAQALADPAPEA
jgi:hypothetical protein